MTAKFISRIVYGIGVVFIASCAPFLRPVQGSGDIETYAVNKTGFSAIDISTACTATITYGDSFSVIISIDDNVKQYVNVTNDNGTLKVGLDWNYSYTHTSFSVAIVCPSVNGIELSGASNGMLIGYDSSQGDVSLEVSGASILQGTLYTSTISLDVSGASELTLSGSGTILSAEVSGASKVDFREFTVGDARLDISGASTVRVLSNGTISGEVSGASTLECSGSPHRGKLDISGASTVRGL